MLESSWLSHNCIKYFTGRTFSMGRMTRQGERDEAHRTRNEESSTQVRLPFSDYDGLGIVALVGKINPDIYFAFNNDQDGDCKKYVSIVEQQTWSGYRFDFCFQIKLSLIIISLVHYGRNGFAID